MTTLLTRRVTIELDIPMSKLDKPGEPWQVDEPWSVIGRRAELIAREVAYSEESHGED